MKDQILSYVPQLDTNILLTAADELGLKIEILDKESSLVKIYENEKKHLLAKKYVLDANLSIGPKISKSKYLTYKMLNGNVNIPSFKYVDLQNYNTDKENIINEISDFYRKFDGKVVIKAVNLAKGKGIFIKPNLGVLDEIIKEIQELESSPALLMEEFISSEEEYRIIVYKDKIIDIIRRYPAFVEGDGKLSIKELWQEKIINRKSMGISNNPSPESFNDYLYKKNIDINYTPSKDEFVRLAPMCNLTTGGEVKSVDIEKFNDDLKKMIIKTAKSAHINYTGVDLMTSDSTKNPSQGKSFVNEINSAPGINMIYFANLHRKDPLISVKRLIKSILNDESRYYEIN
jgi:cyanophycin synthetase